MRFELKQIYTTVLGLLILFFHSLAPSNLLAQDDENTVITLLVVYTEEAEEWADKNKGGIDNVISQGIAFTNQVMQNSEIAVEVKLANSEKVDYEESGDNSLDLRRMYWPNDGYLDEVITLRNKYSADLINLIVFDANVAGSARVPFVLNDVRKALSVIAVKAATGNVFAHEIGHNLGFVHSRNQKSQPAGPEGGIKEYSTGWQWWGNDGKGYVSIMSYDQPPEFEYEAPHFSNPNVKFKDGKTGSYSGKGAPADNARSLEETKLYFAGYRGQANEEDSLLLVSIYNKMGGENWHKKKNWLSKEPLFRWEHIENNDLAYKMFLLSLQNNNLKGDLIDEFFEFDELIGLNLGGNEISGKIPAKVKKLKNLEEFDVKDNQLHGEIPSEIFELSKLEFLILKNNSITGELSNDIGKLTELFHLDLGSNNLSGPIPKSLYNLKNLFRIRLYNNEFSGPLSSKIENLTDLRNLYLQLNNFSGPIPDEIGNLKKLGRIDLSSNNFEGRIPSSLSKMNLYTLALDHNKLRGSVPESFLELENLERFRYDADSICLPSSDKFMSWYESLERTEEDYVLCEDVQVDGVVVEGPADESTNQSLEPVLEWSQSLGAESYHVQLSTTEDFSELLVDTTGISGTSFESPRLDQKTTYYWRVRASNAYLDSPWTDVASFATADAPPPANLVLNATSDQIELQWDAVDSDMLSAYVIYKGNFSSNLEEYERVVPSQTTYSETLSGGSSFYAVAGEYGDGIVSNVADVLSYYKEDRPVTGSWQMIGVPVDASPVSVSNMDVYRFNRIYRNEDTIQPNTGYWVRSNSSQPLDIQGPGILETDVSMQEGWNLISGISDEVGVSEISDPSGILSGAPLYTYNGSSYEESEVFIPGNGYWIHASEEGTITLTSGEPKISSAAKQPISEPIVEANVLEFRNPLEQQTLSVSLQPLSDQQRLRYLMPPQAPEPVLDVRTIDQYSVADGQTTPFTLTSSIYPVEVSLDIAEDANSDYAYRIVGRINGNEIHHNLTPTQSVKILQEYDQLYLESVKADELITEFSLSPNYPNPFNPVTNIQYQLPEQSQVQVDVYNIAGRKVATLVNENQQPGMYTVQFDGGNQASGIYFLRLKAGQYSSIQKLTLIK